MALPHAHESEHGDFEAMLKSLGRTGDFEAVYGTPKISAPPGAFGLAEIPVIVTCLPTGKSKNYTSGDSRSSNNDWPAWVNDVERDIKSGTFD